MKLVARLAVPLLALAALAGCAHGPSTAAIVGERVISDAELTEIVDSCRAAGLKPNRSKVLSLMVSERSSRAPPGVSDNPSTRRRSKR